MKYGLPDGHGLSARALSDQRIVPVEDGEPSLTDIQFSALQSGVARGTSMLVVSPTSTGKTQIGIWAAISALERAGRCVYLVTHRALAAQKLEEFRQIVLPTFLDNVEEALVVATGDAVLTAAGNIPSEPLASPFLIATYEKYLGMLSASGPPKDLSDLVVICDEMQLVGDPNRGQNTEILLTLLRNVGVAQLVALSAVLDPNDAEALADWLGITTLYTTQREKHLIYQLRTQTTVYIADTSKEGITEANRLPIGTLNIVRELHQNGDVLPVIVFCMRVADTFQLAQEYAGANRLREAEGSLFAGRPPETATEDLLARLVANRVAFHSADLTEEERRFVELELAENRVDVVFATSTLAAGVNFPLGAAVFDRWKRWDQGRGQQVPIPESEFHNMAGRVGRMGTEQKAGLVVFSVVDPMDRVRARRYMEFERLTRIAPRINPATFSRIALQLLASGICETVDEVVEFIGSTYSGRAESARNQAALDHWKEGIHETIAELQAGGHVIPADDGKLYITGLGRAVARAGLLPSTSDWIIGYCAEYGEELAEKLPGPDQEGDLAGIFYPLAHACFGSPEFGEGGRSLPYQLNDQVGENPEAETYAALLTAKPWFVQRGVANAASLTLDWIEGRPARAIEDRFQGVRRGRFEDLCRTLSWLLNSVADVIAAASASHVPDAARPEVLQGEPELVAALRKLPRLIRRFAWRVTNGLPDEVLWMTQLEPSTEQPRLSRREILALRDGDIVRPQDAMLGAPEADERRREAFANAQPSPDARANWFRDASRHWKRNQRGRLAELHVARVTSCDRADLVPRFYEARGTEFHELVAEVLNFLEIPFEEIDIPGQIGRPDLVISVPEMPRIVLEIKSKAGENLVGYNDATEILASSEVHGYGTESCVTLCHPGVDPSVPPLVSAAGRLCIVESADLCEALIRICEGTLIQEQLASWLTEPGQAELADLPPPKPT